MDLKSTTVKMDKPVLVGLAVCGMNLVAKAVYDNFTITQDGKEIFPLAVSPAGKLTTIWAATKAQ